MGLFHFRSRTPRGLIPILSLVAVLCGGGATAFSQQADSAPAVDKATLQLLLKRIDQLEARVSQLEAERASAASGAAALSAAAPSQTLPNPPAAEAPRPATAQAQTPAKPTAAESEQSPTDNAMADRMDLSKTLLRIRGFGDISLHGDTMKGDTTSFSLGQLDLFVTSDVSDKFKFLSEIVFEAGPNSFYGAPQPQPNSFDVDLERYLLQYSLNDYLNISAGRGHTSIGYYNTAYHHSTWLQTTTGRPFLFNFEDEGGILPIHMVGVTASGAIPSGQLGLHYVAEVGNGRESRDPLDQEPVQNEVDDESHKAYNLALFARPEALHGFQTGISVYRDILAPENQPRLEETIVAGHAILIRPKYEWLNEALLDRHTSLQGGNSFNSPGFYSQVSRQFGSYRPYFRYEYLNVSNREPILSDVGLRHGPLAGLRFDASESVALKFQYDRTYTRNQPAVNGLTLQLGFTF
jgi:hypothetical protein